MNIFEAIETRRSVKSFDPAHVMPDADLAKLVALTQLAPSSFNIQHTRIVHVTDKPLRAEIQKAAWHQAQITEASALFVFCADTMAWKKDPARYWQHAPQQTQDYLVPMIAPFHEGNDQLQRDEALRSVGLSAQTMMLAARGMGYDSCPMIGFDQAAVAKLINLPHDHIIGMIVTVGKGIKPAHPRGSILPMNEVLITNHF